MPTTAAQPYFHQKSVTPISTAMRGRLAGSTWLLYLASCLSKVVVLGMETTRTATDRKSTRLNSSHLVISYAVFCLKKKKPPRLSSRANRSGPCSRQRRSGSQDRHSRHGTREL